MAYVINKNTNEVLELETPINLISRNYSTGDWEICHEQSDDEDKKFSDKIKSEHKNAVNEFKKNKINPE